MSSCSILQVVKYAPGAINDSAKHDVTSFGGVKCSNWRFQHPRSFTPVFCNCLEQRNTTRQPRLYLAADPLSGHMRTALTPPTITACGDEQPMLATVNTTHAAWSFLIHLRLMAG